MSSPIGNRLNFFRDVSGLINVSVFSITSGNQQQHFNDFGVGAPRI